MHLLKKFVPAYYKLSFYSYCKKYHLDFLFIVFCFTMAWFSRVFGGNSKKRDVAPTPQEAIQRLRETEEMLVKKQEYLEKKIESEVATAKRYGTKNKRFLKYLILFIVYEKQLQQIDGTLATIEFQREALENASTNTEVLNVMGHAAKALKAAHNNMDVDKVHDLMDDISEQQDVANEISEAISNPIGLNQDVDEDDLMAELEELEQEELDKQLLNVAPTPKLPDVPSTTSPEIKEASQTDSCTVTNSHEEDEMLKELKAWAYTVANVTVRITNAYPVQQFHSFSYDSGGTYAIQVHPSHGDTVPGLIGGSCSRWHQIHYMSQNVQKYTEDKRCAAIITSVENDKSRAD
ncbi:Charged multivesicular body protein 4b [Trichinella patagoniensis]|uniref:Charged multivesicular body protein 4b n=1 Tax=Trichinella patagoniensis TaxID=990121 RepID=A0A0V0ZEZ8_9BILA|nr:Charged multivesicular body protein 4b [Trichinella patagoniensis]